IGSPAMNFVEVAMSGQGDGAKLSADSISIPLPGRLRQAVGPTSDRKLIAGFRPEHMEVGEATDGAAQIDAKADVVEYLGNEELIHANAGGLDLVALIGSEALVKPGDVLTFHVAPDKLHLFDKESGSSLVADRVATPA
ncbi:MAG: TOBE domain-containing protein, partial [Candidatus Limnocylindrales bacterium]